VIPKKWFRRLRDQKSRKMARNRNFDRNFSGISNLGRGAAIWRWTSSFIDCFLLCLMFIFDSVMDSHDNQNTAQLNSSATPTFLNSNIKYTMLMDCKSKILGWDIIGNSTQFRNNFTSLCYSMQTSHQFGSQFHNNIHTTTTTKPHMTINLKMTTQWISKQNGWEMIWNIGSLISPFFVDPTLL
jgi:hypothetical protein